MSTCCPIKLGSVGSNITIKCIDCLGQPVNLAGATVTNINFRSPTGALKTVTANVIGDPTLGVLSWVHNGELNEPGTWDGEPYLETPTYVGAGGSFSVPVSDRIPAA